LTKLRRGRNLVNIDGAKLRAVLSGLGVIDFVHITTTRGLGMAADPESDYWTVADVAEYWGVSSQTIRTYRSRGRGELPKEDRMFERSPAWKPSTIIDFERPGQGARTDLQ
jgi:hypothetical protein